MALTTIEKNLKHKIDVLKQKESKGKGQVIEARLAIAEAQIDIGESLIKLKKDMGRDFDPWLASEESAIGLKTTQAGRYVRAAVHQGQYRALIKSAGASSLMDAQKLLPRATEQPLEEFADPETLGYVGTKPGMSPRDDWYTPELYINMAREVMGSIDLDPFSSAKCNERIQAKRYLSKADDAFMADWASPGTHNVWMNPPYSKGASGRSVDKFLEEFDKGAFSQAVVLMNNSADTGWYDRMINTATAFGMTRGRIAFENDDGKGAKGNTCGQVFFYFGNRPEKFISVFKSESNAYYTGTL